ncbi:MAG: transglycosylase SLT domain-containing protein, partial [Phaeodactylibacter sp.]|nr:transglycosylase SLT domain-containing protein [Phaeodactylibacter sp.]
CRIEGRAVLYFPIFEHYLKQYNLPLELKYLPMIESALRPNAVSGVGATGLWQFMSPTATELGLRNDHLVDERRDPYKSTEAAVKYLAGLYERFGNWELALSAYNCGAGNVWKAVKSGGTRNYWQIREFLPQETRDYIPRFIAASYLGEYYTLHHLAPSMPDYDMQFTKTIKVYSAITVSKIASAANISESVIYKLNPAYQKGVLPYNANGNYLVLPELGMIAFKDYLRMSNDPIQTDLVLPGTTLTVKGSTDVIELAITVKPGQTLVDLAMMYECTASDIREWNNLSSNDTYYMQELRLFVPKALVAKLNKRA